MVKSPFSTHIFRIILTILADADAAVVYPAGVDVSWVDSHVKAKRVDSDEAVVYPAKVDLSWVDGSKK